MTLSGHQIEFYDHQRLDGTTAHGWECICGEHDEGYTSRGWATEGSQHHLILAPIMASRRHLRLVK